MFSNFELYKTIVKYNTRGYNIIFCSEGKLCVINVFALTPLQVNEEEPRVMWLSGLHIPESYLTALVQATCRKNGWPLDKSTLYTTVTNYATADDVSERAHQG